MEFHNTYQDPHRAAAYDQLQLGGTYHLAFRDLPTMLDSTSGCRALDFGCGTGRSTRFLQRLGFKTVGVDISREMVLLARDRDPCGDYRVIENGDFSSLTQKGFDLVLSAFSFDNIPGRNKKISLLQGLRELMCTGGRMVNIVSTPEIYTHEWVTFTTRNYPENAAARCGDVVRIITTDYSDNRPVDDILWPDEDYQAVYSRAGLSIERFEQPLARGDEGVPWVNETRVAPWSIYVLRSLC